MQKWLQFWGPDPPSACPWCPDCLVSVGIGARLPQSHLQDAEGVRAGPPPPRVPFLVLSGQESLVSAAPTLLEHESKRTSKRPSTNFSFTLVYWPFLELSLGELKKTRVLFSGLLFRAGRWGR